MGNIGKMAPEVEEEWVFWEVVGDLKSMEEILKWDIDDVFRYHSLMLQKRDYERAIRTKMEAKSEEK